jgi:hypothetical protein
MSSSDVSSVTNHFPTVNEGFVANLNGSILAGATTVPLSHTTGLTNGTVFVGVIELGDAKQQTFTGTVDVPGSQITGVKWTRGSDVDHATGVTVVDIVAGTGVNMTTKGISVSHNQDGTLKDDTVDTDQIVDDAIETSKILDANVTTAKLADASVTGAKILNYKVEEQRITTNSQPTTQIIQRGWYWANGSGSGSVSTRTVTLPVAFANTHYTISISCIGFRTGSDPTTPTDFSAAGVNATARIISASQFSAILYDYGTTMSASTRFGFSWIAIGEPA